MPSTRAAEAPTRSRILSAAERLFAEQGYNGVSMPQIAKASGITPGAIYRHFESKEDLFFEAVAERAVQALHVAEERAGETSLPRTVAAYTTGRLKLLRQLAIEIHAASVHNAKVRRLLTRSLERNIGDLREAITAAQNAGRIDKRQDATALARAVMVFIMGLMHMDTLLPTLVDDAAWSRTVEDRVAALIGLRA